MNKVTINGKIFFADNGEILSDVLIKSGKLVFEAAMEVGYGDPSTFYRNFRKHFGVSPSEYK